jgi:hypothetical protein
VYVFLYLSVRTGTYWNSATGNQYSVQDVARFKLSADSFITQHLHLYSCVLFFCSNLNLKCSRKLTFLYRMQSSLLILLMFLNVFVNV